MLEVGRLRYGYVIPEEDASILRSMLKNRRISALLTPSASIYSEFVIAPHFSVQLERDSYIVFENLGSSTPSHGIEYSEININQSHIPKEIAVGRTPSGDTYHKRPLSLIYLFYNHKITEEIVSITIHDFTDGDVGEDVHCDVALVFWLDSGRRFAISAQTHGFRHLEYTCKEERIKELLDTYPCRQVIA